MTLDHVVKWACPRSAGARLSTRETASSLFDRVLFVSDPLVLHMPGTYLEVSRGRGLFLLWC